jgi:Tol biopolymer transport system component
MRRFFLITMLLVGLSGLAAAGDHGRPVSATLRSWKLAFVRNGDIWVSKGDGTDQKLIIKKGQAPSWSPDKSRIAFVRDNTIWVAMADGSEQRPVTAPWRYYDPKHNAWFSDIAISWHPKHRILTFSRPEVYKVDRVEETADIIPSQNTSGGTIVGSSIFDVHLNGKAQEKTTVRYDLFAGGTSFFFADHAHPAWSPSGRKLAFTRNGDIWLAEMANGPEGEPPGGWEVRRLAAVASYDEPTMRASRENCGATKLSWSPDERHLVYGYERLQGSGFNEVHVLDMKNGKDSLLVEDAHNPCFSPDGKFVAYWSGGCGEGMSVCIRSVSIDGKTKRKLVEEGRDPAW